MGTGAANWKEEEEKKAAADKSPAKSAVAEKAFRQKLFAAEAKAEADAKVTLTQNMHTQSHAHTHICVRIQCVSRELKP